MAINSYYDEKNQVQTSNSTCSKAPNPLTIQELMGSHSVTSSVSKQRTAWDNSQTAYRSSDRIQLLAHHIEEKDNKKALSSFQLAANIYKCSSDELRLKKKLGKKSNKKSVLTLPNEPSILPQVCTVSDMNDSEYFNRNDKSKAKKTKKRLPLQRNKKPQLPKVGYECYDRDANYCSQMDVYLDCSSTDVVKKFKGDGRRNNNASYNSKPKSDDDVAPHNVWAVLRDINRFQFQPSPPMSDNSIMTPRKKRVGKKKLQKGVYETCRTEQIAYISSIELNVKSSRDGSLSEFSSLDRITVIDTENGFSKMYNQVQKAYERRVPHLKPKKKREKSPKHSKRSTKNKCITLDSTNKLPECKTNDQTKILQIQPEKLVKNAESKETVVEIKSENSITSTQTSQNYNTLKDLSTKKVMDEEIHTETISAQKEDEKSQNNSKLICDCNVVTNAEVLPNASPNKNTRGHLRMKVPLRRTSLPPREQKLNVQPRPNTTSTRPINPIINGITKTVLTPGKGFTLTKLSETPIPPQDTMVTSTRQMNQITQSEIRRTLAKIKFPLVILGKDQLSGSLQVEEYDYPQFNGLDKQIWPYMRDWSRISSIPLEPVTRNHIQLSEKSNYNEYIGSITAKPVQVGSPNKHLYNGKKPISPDVNLVKYSRNEHINLHNKNKEEGKQNGVSRLKPILQFRDKMLKLLYKKASNQNIVNDSPPAISECDVKSVGPIQIHNSNTNLKNEKMVTDNVAVARPRVSRLPVRIIKPVPLPPTSPSKILLPRKETENKRNWGKAKWASDLIENIFQKIKNGTYYTNEFEYKPEIQPRQTTTTNNNATCDINHSSQQVRGESKEVSIQVTMPIISEDLTPKITIQKKKEPLILLPGFDDVLPSLEIKSMTRNQIAVRNCVTNVILQFDVNVPVGDHTRCTFKRSTSCIPLTVTESKTRVFKCKAKILNAMLPAELCSIIPKVMKQFLEKDTHLAITLQERKINPSLTPISEYTVPLIQEVSKLPLMHLIPEFPISELMSSKLKSFRDGRFLNTSKPWIGKPQSNENIYIVTISEPYEYHHVEGLLPYRPIINYQEYFGAHLQYPLMLNSAEIKPTLTTNQSIQNPATETINLCRDLVPYTRNNIVYDEITNVRLPPTSLLKDLFTLVQQGNKSSITEYSSFPFIQLPSNKGLVSFDLSIGDHKRIGTSVSIKVANLTLDSLYNATRSLNSIANVESFDKRTGYNKHGEVKDPKRPGRERVRPYEWISKSKKTGYVKLYKKCKSTSHIAAERSGVSLSKLTNLDEFFQALGTGNKLLASAFDGGSEKKILSCISEMKNWITEITPRQALLVMLLTNKRDTSNLLRFRPVLLQGIAMNRITRVSELDMEIEVIERERFNKLSEYPGIPSLLENTQNNNLFEELCWIAKTTASDYQMKFDESSEKLLKSLLQKRRNSNPSYLRVMARYVGLGLLKRPATH